ncbi:MAG: secretin N-terminal domain-containing protein, partial [Deltaproteobacteria bacterium]
YNVQHTVAADLAKILQTLLAEGKKATTPKEKIFITAYPATNSLLISAPPEDMKEIERIISEVDTLRPQVLVEAAIIEVTTARGEELGVEWLTGAGLGDGGGGAVAGGVTQKGGNLVSTAAGIVAGVATGGAAGATMVATAAGNIPSGLNIGVFGGSITYGGQSYPALGAFIHALSTKDNINIISHPQLLTMNNEEAEITVGTNIPSTTSTRVDTAGNPINSYDYRDVGVKLKIKPTINKDGFVYLNIQQEVTKVVSAIVSTGATSQIPAPTTYKRATKTIVGVRDSQTIVISGLISDDTTESDSGVPFLSNIPVLGYLFGTKTKKYDKTNLLVFITPRIIYSPQQIEQISKEKKQQQDILLGRAKKIEEKLDKVVFPEE